MAVALIGDTVEEQVLGAGARSTLEDFILDRMSGSASTALDGVAITADNIKAASIAWEDDGAGGTEVRLSVRFEATGSWSAG